MNLCKAQVVLKHAKKLRSGVYQCPECKSEIAPIEAQRRDDVLLRVKFACPRCEEKGEKEADEFDVRRYRRIAKNLRATVTKGILKVPKEVIPDADRQRDDALYQKGIRHFRDLFIPRNLLGNALLKKAILATEFPNDVRELMILTFSATLAWTSIMTSSTGHGWQHHGYWLPNVYFEMNVWEMFRQRFAKGQSTVLKGKEYSKKEIGDFSQFAVDYADLRAKTCLLINQSSDRLPLPQEAADVIITDPPFGGNVQYAELSYFWTVWLKGVLGLKGIFDNCRVQRHREHESPATS
jgi:adenine-specific DNA methylase